MNAPLRRVAIAFLVLFGLLLVNVTYIQGVQADSLRDKPTNARVLVQQYQHDRGEIVVSGKPIATSKPTDDRLKYLRTYADGPLYAPATGYYSLFGATGIERESDDVLAGTDDRFFVRRLMDLVTGKQPRGGTVVLTLDEQAQRTAYEDLAGKHGAVVALDPRTGAILALASRPSYDPNKLASHDAGKVRDAYDALSHDEDQPLLDRAIGQTYPPGSTFKIVTAAAALSTGKYDPSTTIPAPNALPLPQSTHSLHNFEGETCGNGETTTLADAVRMSCNTGFAKLGMTIGADTLQSQAEKLGLNDRFQIPMTSAESVFPKDIDEAQTALSAIGQYNVRVTPLQGAMVASAVANDGVMMKPHLVKEIKGPNLSTIEKTKPEEYGEAFTPEVASQLTDMMKLVVADGTGTAAQIPGVEVAGKTGTADHGAEEPHAWFISFAPADDPQIAIAVLVEDGGQGGIAAAPIAKDVMEAVLNK